MTCCGGYFLKGRMSTYAHSIWSRRNAVSRTAYNHSVSPVQILLAWAIQSQTLPVVQTLNFDHIKENIMLSDLKLSENEMEDINRLSGVS